MRIMSLDYGFANSGVCISEISNNNIKVLFSEVLLSDKELHPIERIDGLVEEIHEICEEYDVDFICKEAPFVGRASTAKPLLYAHAILEHNTHLFMGMKILDIHNATLKAFCKKYLISNSFYSKDELKQFDKKQVVAEFLKAYFGDDIPDIYTKRGRLKDDQADAIALSVYYFEKNLK